ncbi:MAG: hypothetical protein ACKOW9_00245, partial [Candidatus Paceibacterota bacterium]
MRQNPISFLLVIFLGVVLLPNPLFASSQIYFSNTPKQVEEGDRLSVGVQVRAEEGAINAVSGTILFPSELLRVVAVNRDNSIVNFWTVEPKIFKDKISFEGVILNPGFAGSGGALFRMTFEAKSAGLVNLRFSDGALLANDGLGTNLLASFGSANFRIVRALPVLPLKSIASTPTTSPARKLALPVIIEYPSTTNTEDKFTLRGKGEPGFLTRIVFKDLSVKSIGERFVERVQTKKKRLDEVLVKNDSNGFFEYVSPSNLVAGVYNATPFLV